MKRCKLGFISVISMMVLATYSLCFGGAEGTSGAPFLKIGIGARAVGMGEAFCGLADDINAIYWNPAGLVQIENREFEAMHINWLLDINYEYVAYAQRIQDTAVMAGAIGMLKVKGMEEWIKEGEYKGKFTADDMVLTVAYAKEVNDSFTIGGNVKYINQTIAEYSASTYGIDLGVLYKPEIQNLMIGGNISNIGGKLKFKKSSDPLPMNIRIGGSYRIPEMGVMLTGDVNIPNDTDVSIRIGCEYSIPIGPGNELYLRGGYKTGVDLGELCCGLGFSTQSIAVDYAFVPYDELKDAHRISLIVRF
jgi:hypothetical protein